MALIKCNECGQDISDKADFCLKCGKPMEHHSESEEAGDTGIADTVDAFGGLLNSAGAQAVSNQYFTYKNKQLEIEKIVKEQENQTTKKYFFWRWSFTLILSAITFGTIGILGYQKLIDNYVVGTLLGTVVGYLFGQTGKQK
ncbi:MAG: zinc ribbon domain-containing protein [Planctomycetes bacterium]|nr:zinc ribbon domain-containing protein [Planctomycetota bacterium]